MARHIPNSTKYSKIKGSVIRERFDTTEKKEEDSNLLLLTAILSFALGAISVILLLQYFCPVN